MSKRLVGARPSSIAPDAAVAYSEAVAADDNDGPNPETGEVSINSVTGPSVADELLRRTISFRPFTKESYRRLVEREATDKANAEKRASRAQEAHLVDGKLIFGADDDESDQPPAKNPELREGSSLHEDWGTFPTKYYGKPLEDIDQGIRREKTFIVIGKKFQNKNIFRFSATRSCFILPPWNIIRRTAIYIATHQAFDLFIIATILVNCVFLTMPGYTFTETSEFAFLGIYVVEMIVKVLARGFIIGSYTYLRDPWNWLDFIVILSAFTTIIIDTAEPTISVGNLQGMRTFRVFRALKTVSVVQGLKTMVNALLRAFRMLFEVILLTLFCLMVFALFALQIYMGTLRQKCVKNIDNYTATPSLSYDKYFAEWIRDSANWQMDRNEEWYQLCGNTTGTGTCAANYTCLPDIGENPNYGLIGFDHFGWSMITCFQLLTLDFWEDTYSKVISTSGSWNVLFFLIIIFFGAFYLLNLMLAVVAMSYEEEVVSTLKEKELYKVAKPKKTKHKSIYDLARHTVKMREQAKKTMAEKQSQDHLTSKTDAKDSRSETVKTAQTQISCEKNTLQAKKKPVSPQKPLVKFPSEDSGYSSQSQPSNGRPKASLEVLRHHEDAETASKSSRPEMGKAGTGSPGAQVTFKDSRSALELKQRNPLIKQESMGTVSSSGVYTDKDGISSNTDDELYTVRGRSTGVIILTAVTETTDENLEGKLVDRNCRCCGNSCCCCCFVPWLRLQNVLYSFVSDPMFDLAITFCIILNTLFLALEHHGMSSTLKTVLGFGNYVFTAIFTLEALLKIIALGKYYFMNGWNDFDLIVVLSNIVDLSVENVKGLSVLRTFRLLRVVKLAKSWTTMRILLTIIISTLSALGYLTFILFLIIYIFAVMGLQLFQKEYEKYNFDGTEAERWHFKDFYHAFMMIFRVLCGEWVEPMWQCMRAANELCMAVFLPALVIGNFIVLNLFLALLINAFATDTIDKHKQSAKDSDKLGQAFERLKHFCCHCCPFLKKNTVIPAEVKSAGHLPGPLISSIIPEEEGEIEENDCSDGDEKTLAISGLVESETSATKTNGVMTVDDTHKTSSKMSQCFPKVRDSNGKATASVDTRATVKFKNDVIAKVDIRVEDKGKKEEEDDLELGDTAENMKTNSEEAENEDDKDDNGEEDGNKKTLYSCFPNWLRKRLKWIEPYNQSSGGQLWTKVRFSFLAVVDSTYFEWAVLVVIFASSSTLAFEDIYLYQNYELSQALYILNIVFCVLFGIEMVMKFVAYGFTRYFTKFWTILDFCIVMIVVNSLMLAIPSIFNVFLVGMMFWLVFSIMGVQFFAGRFYKCVNATTRIPFPAIVTPNRTYCEQIGQRWENSKVTFDDAGSGFLALFQVATFEGWMEVMQDAVDVTEVDQQPEFENNKYAFIYFVIFIVFGAFFTLNLFISVIIDNFNVLKKKYEGGYLDALLTESQRNYYNTLRKLGKKKPQKTIKQPRSKFLKFFYKIAMSTKLELAIVVLISLNMIVMAIEHYNQTEGVRQALNLLNVIFTTVFMMEAIIKLLGLRWHYFRVPWNIFDFLVVLTSLIDIVLDDILNSVIIKPTLLRVVRVFRIGRVLRLIKAAKGIRKLLFALIISLPAIFNIGALLFLVMYIYAIIGMSSFGDIKLNGSLDELTNFQTFSNSFLLLIRLGTSAGWNDILDGLMISEPDCDPNYKTLPDGTKQKSPFGDCGVPWLAIPFMVSYIIIIFLIIINMYIAVILENFNQAHQQEEVGITEDDFDMFYVVWERYDPHASQFIKFDQLSDFVADLEDPLRIEKPNEITLVSFNLPIMEGEKLHCLDILMALVKNQMSDFEESKELRELKINMERKFASVFPSRETIGIKSTTLQRKMEDVAARTLQRAWHSHKTQKALKNITDLAMSQNSSPGRDRGSISGVRDLGHKLTNALSNFFGSSQSPANSQVSLSTPPSSPNITHGHHLQTLSKQGKLSATLQVPIVNTLYLQEQDTMSQDLEL